uniref:Uncharacterized protein n=1 Tax=Arundo donax TaxID=35708 RepID=A0A0A9GTY0_ARUDO
MKKNNYRIYPSLVAELLAGDSS